MHAHLVGCTDMQATRTLCCAHVISGGGNESMTFPNGQVFPCSLEIPDLMFAKKMEMAAPINILPRMCLREKNERTIQWASQDSNPGGWMRASM